MTQTTPQSESSWLAPEELEAARQRVPILYVDAIPVRVDEQGIVTAVGLLLRATSEGRITRALVSGRVHYHEKVRSALLRHLEKDLGPLALPRIPAAPQPDALELTWFSPAEARSDRLLAEMAGGQGLLLLQGLAHVGY